jgi:urease accessory protein
MMANAIFLAALQHADSFFPTGASAFSWGIETAVADGHVTTAADLAEFVACQLTYRWASCDRPLLLAAHGANGDPDRLVEIDRLAETLALPVEMRTGSARAGGALLAVHERLGTPGATALRSLVRVGRAFGHLPVVQGVVWAGVGLPESEAAMIGAHGLCVSMVGAALRLGCISHIDGQQILTRTRRLLIDLLARPAPDLASINAFTPMTDIALMRHETQGVRLFAN